MFPDEGKRYGKTNLISEPHICSVGIVTRYGLDNQGVEVLVG
jgi:hypothetical protein